MALVVFGVSAIFLIFLIPGVRESKDMIERYKIKDVKKEKESFITSAKKALKQKNFMTIVFITLIGDIAFACLLASIHYFIKYYLQEPASYATVVMAAFLIGALLSIPLWFYLIKKLNNNRKMHIIGIILLLILILPLSFFWDLTSMIVVLILLGIGQAAFKIARFPCLADTIDEAVVNTGVRQESVYMGVQTFWMRFSLIAQALIFAIVHELTGFKPEVIQQTDLALFGFRLQASIIPAIIIFVGLIVFWKFYTLTPEKTKAVKEKLKELGL